VKKNSSNQVSQNRTSAQNNPPVVLLVGNITDKIADTKKIAESGCRTCKNMADAITLAQQERFGRIFVVMSSFGPRLNSELVQLRQASPESMIILLAGMYEEPMARRLIRSARNTNNPVDDYLICPVDVKSLSNGIRLAKAPAGTARITFDRDDYKDKRIRELEKLATEDDLTDLKNRRYVREFLRQITARAKAEGLRITLFLFDIDDFKHYNDTYGHAVGDMVLRQAAAMMRRCCRTHDVIGRIGGDEFAVIFWDLPAGIGDQKENHKPKNERRGADASHPQEALFISERFRKELSSAKFPFLGDKGKGILTISGGLASFSYEDMTATELLEQADQALLEAKRSGKNQIYLVGKPK
jgi:PleD family two-component response regulator